MARRFYGAVTLKDINEDKSTKIYDLGVFDSSGNEGQEFEDALGALDQIVGALSPITNADIVETTIRGVVSTFDLPGAGDLSEQALINVYVTDPEQALDPIHMAQTYVPAPVDGVFMTPTGPGHKIVDVSDTALVQYIDQLAQHAFISDKEVIQVTSGNDGMKSGRRVTRKTPRPTI